MAQAHRSTLRLTDLLHALADLPEQDVVLQRAVEHVARGLEADLAALVLHGEVLVAAGLPFDAAQLAALTSDGSPVLLGGAGTVRLAEFGCDALPGSRLVVGRCAERPFDEDERELLCAMSLVLGMALRARRLVDDERSSRARSDEDAEDSAGLLGEDIAGLRLIDPDNPTQTIVASLVGVPGYLPSARQPLPLGHGVGGRAITEDRLIVVSDYQSYAEPLPGLVEDGIQAAMAAPVRRGGTLSAAWSWPRTDPAGPTARPSRRSSPPLRSTSTWP